MSCACSNGMASPAEAAEVEISQNNQELDASAGQASSNISAKVELIGETAPPPQMVFALRNAQHRVVARAELSPAREVSFADVVPGNLRSPGRLLLRAPIRWSR